MEKKAWGWKLKYMILFLWIFLFSCKARQAEEPVVHHTEKEIVVAAGYVWQWIEVHAELGR